MDASSASSDESRRFARLHRRLGAERLFFGTLLLVCGLLLYQSMLARRVTAIALDGAEVVYVANRQAAEQVLDELSQELGVVEGLGVRFDHQISIYSVLRRGQPLAPPDQAKQALRGRLKVLVPAYALYDPDGKPLVWALTRDDLTSALYEVKIALSGRVGELVEEPKIEASVSDKYQYMPLNQVKTSADEIAAALLGQRTAAREHVVKSGEVAVNIAKQYNLTLDQLKEMNPGKDLTRLQVGDRIALATQVTNPRVTVTSVEVIEQEEEIPPEITEKINPRLKPGEKRLVQAGTPGRQKVSLHILCRNGKPVERTRASTQVIVPARAAQVEVGPAR